MLPAMFRVCVVRDLDVLTDLLLVKIELLVKILCIFWFIVSFYIMYATYG